MLEVVEANSTVEIANKPVEVQETTPVELV